MPESTRFRPLLPLQAPGERRQPDPKAHFKPKDARIARERETSLRNRPAFIAKPPPTPNKCPLCGTDAAEYREQNGGQELLLPGGNPFTCAMCGNTNWNI